MLTSIDFLVIVIMWYMGLRSTKYIPNHGILNLIHSIKLCWLIFSTCLNYDINVCNIYIQNLILYTGWRDTHAMQVVCKLCAVNCSNMFKKSTDGWLVGTLLTISKIQVQILNRKMIGLLNNNVWFFSCFNVFQVQSTYTGENELQHALISF